MLKIIERSGALAALFAAALMAACSTTENAVEAVGEGASSVASGVGQAGSAVVSGAGQVGSAVTAPFAPPPAPDFATFSFDWPWYDQYEYNEYGFRQFGHRGARCVRLSEDNTCAWWLTG